jgi:hypothetical protein
MVMPMFFGVDRTGPLDFVGIKGAQLRLIRLQEQTNEDSNNEDNESDKGFLHACQSPFPFTKTYYAGQQPPFAQNYGEVDQQARG